MRKIATKRRNEKEAPVSVDAIDYEKLAEAIVKAQELAKKGKRNTNKFRGSLMSFLNGCCYILISTFAIAIVVGAWVQYAKGAAHSLLNCIVITIMLAFVGIYAFLCHQESLNDSAEDAQQHFNTNVALIALVISLIALARG